ncbi:MAG: response regulator [Planctomycetes bacterium]|nr:response regulator [Planctomycetota bacterium]
MVVARTLLIADDEANLRTLVRTTLEDPEHTILEAADGSQALELAREKAPDLVLVDWMMPGMNGLEVTKRLRADPATAGTPVIMLTARGQSSDRAQALRAGVSAFLAKPFSPLELLETVRRVLE